MAATATLSILVASIIPAWQQNQSRQRLLQTAEDLAQDLRSARSLSRKHNSPYFIHFDISASHSGVGTGDESGENWCYSLATQADCHCLAPTSDPNCQLTGNNNYHRISSHDYPGIRLTEARFGTQHYTRFEPVRGTARFGRLLLEDNFQRQLQINVSLLGRIRICHPSNTLTTGAYPVC